MYKNELANVRLRAQIFPAIIAMMMPSHFLHVAAVMLQ